MFLVHNERTKLTAAWFNTLATALVAAGTFAPIAALLYGFSNTAADRSSLAVSAVICFVGGIALHLGGRVLLRSLRE
jgi:hypothetical protein